MTEWLKWTAPPAIVLSVASPVYATQYVTVEQAQKLAFPEATQFVWAPVVYTPAQITAIEKRSGQRVLTRGEQVWKAEQGNRFLGFFIVDYVIGKHLAIDYVVALDPQGRVGRVEILNYREAYGGEIRDADWLKQFVGKTSHDSLSSGQDIRIISGATLSSRHVTVGIKRVLALYQTVLRHAADDK